jgi:predicted transcriptional regulator
MGLLIKSAIFTGVKYSIPVATIRPISSVVRAIELVAKKVS